jgi:hypothetical protein
MQYCKKFGAYSSCQIGLGGGPVCAGTQRNLTKPNKPTKRNQIKPNCTLIHERAGRCRPLRLPAAARTFYQIPARVPLFFFFAGLFGTKRNHKFGERLFQQQKVRWGKKKRKLEKTCMKKRINFPHKFRLDA